MRMCCATCMVISSPMLFNLSWALTHFLVCPSACVSVCQCVLSVCPSVSVLFCRCVRLSMCCSVGVSVCQWIALSVCPSVSGWFCRCVRLSVGGSVGVCVSGWFCVSVGGSVCQCQLVLLTGQWRGSRERAVLMHKET